MGALRKVKTKRMTRALDQVYGDLRNPRQLQQLKESIPDEDKPALGAYHCIECSKYFEQEHNLVQHRRGKNHKRRVRLLLEEPYSQKEAEAAAGIGTVDFYTAKEARAEAAQNKMDVDASV